MDSPMKWYNRFIYKPINPRAIAPQRQYSEPLLFSLLSHLWPFSLTYNIWPLINWKGKLMSLSFQLAIVHKPSILWPNFIRKTYRKSSYMDFNSIYHITFDLWLIERANIGHWVFSGLYFINQASCDQILLETHIGRHIWSFSLPQDIWPWMKFKCPQGHITFKGNIIWYNLVWNTCSISYMGFQLTS